MVPRAGWGRADPRASAAQEARCQKTPKSSTATQREPVEGSAPSLPHPYHQQILLALPSKFSQCIRPLPTTTITVTLSRPPPLTCCSFLTTSLSSSQVCLQHSSRRDPGKSQATPPQCCKLPMASSSPRAKAEVSILAYKPPPPQPLPREPSAPATLVLLCSLDISSMLHAPIPGTLHLLSVCLKSPPPQVSAALPPFWSLKMSLWRSLP